MSQAGTVSWLAVRELWISFRMLILLMVFIGAGAAVALIPGSVTLALTRLGVGLGLGCVLVAAVAAWSFAEERLRGRAGWLVARSVRRGTLLGAWFVALSAIGLVGLLAAAALGWLTANAGFTAPDPLAYLAGIVAAGGTMLASVAVGLLCGCLLPRRSAAVASAMLCAVLGAVAWLLPAASDLVPGGAVIGFVRGELVVAGALRSLGAGLVAAAALLVLARLVLEHAEL